MILQANRRGRLSGNDMQKYIFLFIFVLASAFTANSVLADTNSAPCVMKEKYTGSLPSWFYKVTVSISTPDGIKSGSAIWHDYWEKDQNPTGLINKHQREAVPINMGRYGFIFAILKGSHGQNRLPFISARMLPCTLPQNVYSRPELEKYITSNVGHKQLVNPINYPDIIRFKNIDDPESIEIIYANNEKLSEKPFDNFTAYFGQGVFLKEVTVEIVDQTVDWKLQNYLPWIETPNTPSFEFFRQGFRK